MCLSRRDTRSNSFTGDANGVNAVAFSPNGSCALTASDDGMVRVWDLVSGGELALWRSDRRVSQCRLPPMTSTRSSSWTAWSTSYSSCRPPDLARCTAQAGWLRLCDDTV
ncbi:WD40 repeat domain-containing protein [Actinomadura sp. NPDC049753]|uniref:WD40 repeat domain-containing protein n=1 Tax=Actinomadura sp. NPDC049753 TaxID=3154739 RepID=UPI003421BD7D